MSSARHTRLKELFLEACELDDGSLETFVASSCGADDELRVELRAMLAVDRQATDFLCGPAAVLDRSFAPGEVLDGKFEVRELLGEGGLGEVWRAEQLHPVRRAVALKVIRLGMDTRRVIERFEAERQTLAQLDHPGIAKVLDAGSLPGGRPYFVMEHIEGVRITRYADQAHLGLRARLDLFLEVCQAAQHAHQKGWIHRDLKPSNVLVAEQDGRPAPKLIDFGIAKAVEDGGLRGSLHTLEHQILGTPAYMSPEQAGGSRDVDTRADVYSLGVLLYELLTGTTPFDARGLRESSFIEVVRTIVEEPAPRPSSRASVERDARGRPRREQLRGDLDWIVLRALEKDRERRYPSAEALAADLRRYSDHLPVLAIPPAAAYRLRKFARRNRSLVAAGTLVFLALVAGILSTTHARNQERAARVEAESALEEAELATAFLADVFRSANPDEEGKDVRVIDVLDRSAEEVGRKFADRPRVESRLRATIGYTYRALGLLPEAASQLEIAIELSRAAYPAEHPLHLDTLTHLAVLYDEQRRFAESEPLHRELLELRARVHGANGRKTLGGECNFGLFLYDQMRFEEAEAHLRSTLERMQEHLEPDDSFLLNCMQGLGTSLLELGRLTEAGECFTEVRRRNEAARGSEHSITVFAVSNLAELSFREGRLERSVELYDEAMELCAAVFPPGNWRFADFDVRRAKVLRGLERFHEAIAGLERAHPILVASYGPEDVQTREAEGLLTELHERTGDPARAALWRAFSSR